MKKRNGIIALAVTLVSSLLFFTSCKPHNGKAEFMLDYFSEALDLSPAQESNLADIRTEIMEEAGSLRENKAEMFIILKEQLAGESIDTETLKQRIAEHRLKMNSVIDLAVERLSSFHEELSPEQKEKLIAKLEKFEKHRAHRFHN